MRDVTLIAAEELELSARILACDVAAEAELVRRYEPGLLAIARVRTGPDLAEDVVQETFAVAVVNLRRGDWRGDGPLAAYLATILRRRIARLRGGSRTVAAGEALEQLPDRGIDPLVAAQRIQARERVRQALRALPQGQRDVLVCHYFDGLSVEEVAGELGIPRGTVLSRLHHARRKLARWLNRHGSGEALTRGRE
ncbi:MAG TPA: sigma-70 family RNA polymerase sigma factor [Candidatus Polarisedimenticolaceae bacterium]|nr:sigma-70 family RNA polymerase sigma factor [Candidatus Polarisedimenticolaceae bacterium]